MAHARALQPAQGCEPEAVASVVERDVFLNDCIAGVHAQHVSVTTDEHSSLRGSEPAPSRVYKDARACLHPLCTKSTLCHLLDNYGIPAFSTMQHWPSMSRDWSSVVVLALLKWC